MPPNRKAHAPDTHRIDQNFSGFVKSSSYAPLTSAQREPEPIKQLHSTSLDVELYWNWPAKSHQGTALERIIQEEWTRQLFSVEHITKNLISAASTTETTSKVPPDDNRADSADYWNTPSESMPKEEALHLTSVERIEENLKSEITTSHDSLTESEESLYWKWHSGAAKELLMNEILEGERIRQLLLVDHIEKNLIESRINRSSVVLIADNDIYWTF